MAAWATRGALADAFWLALLVFLTVARRFPGDELAMSRL
jgi:hypothetical protein